jgi:sugar/nucleoside kinase (ribokinase family)
VPKFDVSFAGEINLDLVLYGLAEKLPTERELLATESLLTLGSSSAICAHNLSAMGARVGFVTRVGDDPLGELALARLRESRVDVTKVIRSSASSTGITVVLPHRRERHIITYPGTIFEMTYEDLDTRYVASARHFHMGSFFLHRGLHDDIPRLFRQMKKAGLTTSLDTNDDPENHWTRDGVLTETLKHVDVLFPNEREACKIAGTDNATDAMRKLAQTVPVVVVKRGPLGATAAFRSERLESKPVKVDAVDPIGAGDSFNAGFLYQFVRGASLEKCLRWGNVAGAFSTTQPGGTEAFRNLRAWRAFLRKHRAI